MVLAAGAVAPACVTSTASIACVIGCESSPAVTTSPGDCSCDSIALPLYWPSADSVVPAHRPCNNELGRDCCLPNAYEFTRSANVCTLDVRFRRFVHPESSRIQPGSVKPGITQPPHRRSHLALLLATEQHHQIVAGTQPCITARHDLAFAATQADDQTPRRPTHVTHPLAVRNRPHFQWQFHNAAAHMACDRHLHALRARTYRSSNSP